MYNAIANIIVFCIACFVVHLLVGLTISGVIGISMGIFITDILKAICYKE